MLVGAFQARTFCDFSAAGMQQRARDGHRLEGLMGCSPGAYGCPTELSSCSLPKGLTHLRQQPLNKKYFSIMENSVSSFLFK